MLQRCGKLSKKVTNRTNTFLTQTFADKQRNHTNFLSDKKLGKKKMKIQNC